MSTNKHTFAQITEETVVVEQINSDKELIAGSNMQLPCSKQEPTIPLQQLTNFLFPSSNNNSTQPIVEYLLNFNICVPCMFQICNRKEQQIKYTSEIIQKMMNFENNRNKSSFNCFICFNLYLNFFNLTNDNLSTSNPLQIIDEFECESYNLEFNIPPMLTFRELFFHSILF